MTPRELHAELTRLQTRGERAAAVIYAVLAFLAVLGAALLPFAFAG